MTVWSSTQNPSHTAEALANVLGVPQNRIVVKVKRMGGGFGGKETRSIFIAAAAAVAAQRFRRPVRVLLDRDVDMALTGGRHPFLGRYKVGASKDGRINALSLELYSNAGCSYDLSLPVMDRALFHSDNVYHIPHVHVRGRLCKTHLPSNTAFRYACVRAPGSLMCLCLCACCFMVIGALLREINIQRHLLVCVCAHAACLCAFAFGTVVIRALLLTGCVCAAASGARRQC